MTNKQLDNRVKKLQSIEAQMAHLSKIQQKFNSISKQGKIIHYDL